MGLRLKVIAHRVRFLRVFFRVFIFLIISHQNACYRCENAENRTWSEFFLWQTKVSEVNVIDTTWGRINFSTCENFRLCAGHSLTTWTLALHYCCTSPTDYNSHHPLHWRHTHTQLMLWTHTPHKPWTSSVIAEYC